MGKVAAQAGHQEGFGKATPGFKKVETGFWKSGDRLPQWWRRAVLKDSPCFWSALIGVVLSSDVRAFEIQTV